MDDSLSELRRVRSECHLQDEALAAMIGCSLRSLENWFQGKCMPSRLAQRSIHLLTEELEKNGRHE